MPMLHRARRPHSLRFSPPPRSWGRAGPASAQDNLYDCSDFTFQEDAQDAFDAIPGDTSELDEDGDGIAYERLQHRPTPTPTPTETATPTPTPTATPPPTTTPVGDRDCASFTTQAEAQAAGVTTACSPPPDGATSPRCRR